MSSEETNNKLVQAFGKETKEVQLPSGEKFKLHALTFNQLGELEEFTGIAIADWDRNNPFRKIRSMQYAMYISLKQNANFKLTLEQLGAMFDFSNANIAGEIINEILVLSGIKNVKADEKVGNVQGAVA